MGHLYKGGMWFKKKSVLQAEGHYSTEKSADGSSDLRIVYLYYTNTSSSINSGVPSAADANKYFYLPALGYYDSGKLEHVGDQGYYWSSGATSWSAYAAYHLWFFSGYVYMGGNYRELGFRVAAFK